MSKGNAAAAPAAAPPQPAPPRVVPKRDPRTDIGLQVAELVGWAEQLKRSQVGFNTLNLAYLSVTGQLPPGERKRGLPLFEFAGVLDGKEKPEVVKCVSDLKKVPKGFVPHVLVPLISVHAGELLEAVEEMRARLDLLQPALQAIVAQVQPQGEEAAAPDEEEDEEDDDSE